MYVGVGIQPAKGVPAYRFDWIQPDSISGLLPQFEEISSARRTGTRYRGTNYVGGSSVPVTVTQEANPENIGRVLLALLGSDSVVEDVLDEVYTHTFSITEELPYVTIVAQTAGVADATGAEKLHRVTDVKLGTFGFSGGMDSPYMLEYSGIGIAREPVVATTTATADGTTGGADLTITDASAIVEGMAVSGDAGIPAGAVVQSVTINDGGDDTVTLDQSLTGDVTAASLTFEFAPAWPTADAFMVKSEVSTAKIEIGDDVGALSQFDEAREFTLDNESGLAADNRIDNTANPTGIEEGESELSGAMDVVYNAETYAEIDKWTQNADRAIRFTLRASSPFYSSGSDYHYTLAFTANAAKYNGAPDVSWDPDVISLSLPFMVDVADGFEIALTNGHSGAYSAAN